MNTEIIKLIKNDTDIKLEEFPLLAIAVISNDHTEYVFYNNKSFNQHVVSPPERLIFEIGELSQIYTSYLFYQLNAQGVFSVNDSIKQYIKIEDNPLEKLTLNNLLMNTSGLPLKVIKDALEDDVATGNESPTFQDLVQSYKYGNRKTASHSFNNTDYVVLSHIMSTGSEKTYISTINQFLPVTSHLSSSDNNDPNVIQGHNRIGQLVHEVPNELFFPANGIKNSLESLTNYIKFLMNDSNNRDYFKFVLEEGVENSRFNYVQRHRGWNSVKVNKNSIILLQQGKTNGFTSFVAIYPEGGKAVVLLTNTSKSTEGLGFFILRMISNYWKKN